MNNRGANEKNLVNFTGDISTINSLDTKDGLLTFNFDHIYACHSESAERRQTLQLDKEVEISTCVVGEEKEIVVSSSSEVSRLSARLSASESQNKRLKDLLIYHLDLIQQQNDHITKREKLYQAIKQENDTLKAKLNRVERKVSVGQRQTIHPPPLVHVPPVTSTVVKTEPGSQLILNSFTELLIPDNRTKYIISDISKPSTYSQNTYSLPPATETDVRDVSLTDSYLTGEIELPPLIDSGISCEDFTMIENKRTLVKKEIKTDNRPEPLYKVTSNSGNPVIHRIQRNRRRTSSSLGSLSRMSKSPKKETPESSLGFDDDKSFDRIYSVNKKPKMINTYGKTKTIATKKRLGFGSLSDRLQLMDTTPTGEDPYQLGEADMREQSPIPKLMLHKTNHGRMKIYTDTIETSTSRRDTATSKSKINRVNISPYATDKLKQKTLIVEEPDLDIVKTETEIDWRLYDTNKHGRETASLSEFSYGESTSNFTSNMLPTIDPMDLADIFSSDTPLALHNFTTDAYNPVGETNHADKSQRRAVRTNSLVGSNSDITVDNSVDTKRGMDSKRGRKRAFSTTGLIKAMKRENAQKTIAAKPKLNKGKAAACRGKKSPLPGLVTDTPYHTLVGDPDLSWYLGLDPEVKLEDIDQPETSKMSTVEVPRWREKPYSSCYTMEGTENLDDKVYEKRHQKLEAEERRQLRWHMRRIREQRHVERLRQRQRDSWLGGGGVVRQNTNTATAGASMYTIWPQPLRDVRFIEITDALPVTAFGEILADVPHSDFMLPWVRTSKALKRSKRSKTLH